MNFLNALLLAIFLLVATVYAQEAHETEEQEGQEQEEVQQVFNGDEQKFNQAVQKLFNRFDKDNDGYISGSDLQDFFKSNGNSSFARERANVEKFFSTELKKFDSDNSGNLTFGEFLAGMQPFKNVQFKLKNEVCHKAKQSRKVCKHEFKNSTVENLHMRVKVFSGLCRTGISAASQYPLETCVINAQTCDEKIACYTNQGTGQAPETAVTLSKRSDLHKRGQDFWRFMFWTSVIIIGIAVVPTIILIPFYVIFIIVANKAIDWSKFDN